MEISADEYLPHFLRLSVKELADEVSDLFGIVAERARILDALVKLLKRDCKLASAAPFGVVCLVAVDRKVSRQLSEERREIFGAVRRYRIPKNSIANCAPWRKKLRGVLFV